jgi:hypothetical protein
VEGGADGEGGSSGGGGEYQFRLHGFHLVFLFLCGWFYSLGFGIACCDGGTVVKARASCERDATKCEKPGMKQQKAGPDLQPGPV